MFASDRVTLAQKRANLISNFCIDTHSFHRIFIISFINVIYRTRGRISKGRNPLSVFCLLIISTYCSRNFDNVLGVGAVLILNIRQLIRLFLIRYHKTRGNKFTRGNLHVLNQCVHHHHTTATNSCIKNRRAKTNKTVIPDIGWPMN